MLQVAIRAAVMFKSLFVERLSLPELQHLKVGNLDAAYQNVHDLAEELVALLQSLERGGERK